MKQSDNERQEYPGRINFDVYSHDQTYLSQIQVMLDLAESVERLTKAVEKLRKVVEGNEAKEKEKVRKT